MSIKPSLAFDLIPSLKVYQLGRLAQLTGLPTSGNKSEIISRLTTSLSAHRDSILKNREPAGRGKPQRRILSIDLGLRNLAFCRLLSPLNPLDYSIHGPITLQSWQRLDLANSITTKADSTGSESEASRTGGPLPDPALDTDLDADLDTELDTKPNAKPAKVSFTTPDLAIRASAFLADLILSSPHGPPDTILIEKQRWRSSSSPTIQEWTLRVNTLEAMLWSGLEVMRSHGLWIGDVHSVNPKAISAFWVPNSSGNTAQAPDKTTKPGQGGRKAKAASEVKAAKIAVATRWLQSGNVSSQASAGEAGSESDAVHETDILRVSGVELPQSASKLELGNDSVELMAQAFLWHRRPERQAREALGKARAELVGAIELPKKDDLADCLLQGVAWVKWQQNNSAIVRNEAVLQMEKKKVTVTMEAASEE